MIVLFVITIATHPGLLPGIGRSLAIPTRLAPGEPKITKVEDEFMRRSPELRANFTEFTACTAKCGARNEAIFRKRDEIIARVWPDLLDRLTKNGDWATTLDATEKALAFRSEVENKGGYQYVQKHCKPHINYLWDRNGNDIQFRYRFDGLRCHTPPPADQAGASFL